MPLTDVTNQALPVGRRAKPSAKPVLTAALVPPLQLAAVVRHREEEEQPAEQQQLDEHPVQHTELRDLFSAKLALEDAAAATCDAAPADGTALAPGDAPDLPPGLAAEESGASCSTSENSSTHASVLASPLAAFAVAKARLTRYNGDADSFIAGRQPSLEALRARVAAHRSHSAEEAAGAGAVVAVGVGEATPRRTALAPVGGALPAVAALHQRNQRLQQRLSSTMQLCQTLHEQNQGCMEKVAQLCADNKRLSRSLHEARMDKEGLQQTIRQLTVEAALLAEQARRALLPVAEQPEDEDAEQHHAAVSEGQERCSSPTGSSNSARQDGERASSAGSARSSGSAGAAAWLPGSSVRSFSGAAGGSAAPDAPPAYVQGFSCGEAATSGADKRRRLAPGLLAHCLRPAIAAAVAEAEALEAAGRSPSPGRTPKRKMRHLCSASSSILGAAASPAPDPAAESPAVCVPWGAMPSLGGSPQQQEEHGAGAPAALALAPLAAAAEGGDKQAGPTWHTFDLFESAWFGGSGAGGSSVALAAPAERRLSRRSQPSSVCAMM